MKTKFQWLLLPLFLQLNTFSQDACLREPTRSVFLTGNGINGNQPYALAHGDLNNDGLTDLVVTNYGTSDLSILLGNSNSYFLPVTFYQLPVANAMGSALGDFNNDNNLDVINRYWNSGVVTVHMGNGAGSFTSTTSYTVPNFYYAMGLRVGDYNNDTNQDVYVNTSGLPTDGVLLQGNGNGTFTQTNYFMNYDGPLADVNNDGMLDKVHLSSGFSNTVVIELGTGNLNFGTPTQQVITTTVNPNFTAIKLIVGDLNNDGNQDLVMKNSMSVGPNSSQDHLVTMYGNGLGGFTFGQDLFQPALIQAMPVKIADLNNDQQAEIIVSGTNAYAVYMNNGAGSFSEPLSFPGTGATDAVDIDGDQYKDILVVAQSNNAVTAMRSRPYSFVGGNVSGHAIIEDLDNDGVTEIVTCTGYSSVTVIRNMNNTGYYRAERSYLVGDQPEWVSAGDFNNDGIKDLVTGATFTNQVSVLMGVGGGSFSPASAITVTNNPRMVAVGDFNNNGAQDLAVAIPNNNKIQILMGNGNGTFGAPTTYVMPSNFPRKILVGDLNNNGTQDLIVIYLSSSNPSILMGNANGTFGGATAITQITGDADLGNINNDGNLDLVIVRSNSVSVMLGNGTGGFAAPVTYTTTNTGGSIDAIDLNNDGVDDVLMGFTAGGGLSKLMNNGSGTLLPPVDYANGFTFPYLCTGKINNDVFPDVLSSEQYIYLNTTSNITAASGFTLCQGASLTLNGPAGANSYSWMPGGNTTAALTVTAAGTYSLITSDPSGCVSTSGSITVTALPSPTLVTASQTVCAGTSTVLSATGASTYSWSTGATTGSISVLPAVSTSYTVTGTGSNNCTTTQTLAVTVNTACADVWPGDANSDGLADNLDVLELGLHYGQSGSARATTSNAWQAFYANSWTGTITNGKNMAHADCDGSGLIDASDTLAIYNNYNLTHTFRTGQAASAISDLSIVPDQASVSLGQWGSASIYLGSSSTPVSSINGLAFTLSFDQSLIEADSIYLDYPVSFLNGSNQNLHFRKRVFNSGQLYAATTHTNNSNVSGFGKIASLNFKIKPGLGNPGQLTLSLSQANKSDAGGVISPLTADACTVQALAGTIGFVSQHLQQSVLTIFPNPVKNNLLISGTKAGQCIELVNGMGQVLYKGLVNETNQNTCLVNMQAFEAGIYFIGVYEAGKKISNFKLVKAE